MKKMQWSFRSGPWSLVLGPWSLGILIVLCSLGILVPQTGMAEEGSGKHRFSVTPRIWYSIITIADGTTNDVTLPLYGGTVTFGPKSLPSTDFLVTFFTGSDDADQSASLGAGAQISLDRTDIEALVRYRVKGSNINIFGGFRYIDFESDEFLPGGHVETGTTNFKEVADIFLGEAGVGLFSNITSDGRHGLFANLIGGFGVVESELKGALPGFDKDDDSDVIASFDVNTGYVYNFDRHFSANLRYRAFGIFDFAPEGRIAIVQGPEVGLTARF